MDLDGTKVREEPEPAAQREQGLLRADGRGRIGPLRSADGTEEDRVGVPAGLDVLGPDRDPVRVDRDTAGHDLRPVHREPEPLSGGIDDTPRGVDDLGPDPVARDGDDSVRGKAILRHGRPSPARRFAKATSTPLISAPWSLLVATR